MFVNNVTFRNNLKTRTWAEINLSAMKSNLEYAKRISGKPVICVIKADAYGHGAVECGKFLQENGADMFAVACIEEALELRENGITLPVLILGYTPALFVNELSYYDIEQTIVDVSHAEELNAAAEKAHVRIKTHIKIDTGMGRIGLYAHGHVGGREVIDKAIDDAEHIYNLPFLNVVGMYAHFAVSDVPEEKEYTYAQYKNFCDVRNGLISRGVHIQKCHISNSAAIMEYPDLHFDYVREGIMLYGLYPDNQPQEGELKPVMTLKSRVALVRDIPKGSSISYGRLYKAERDMKVAVISIGYADGFPRRLTNRAIMTINGKQYNQIGRVCMDMCMCDVTGSDVKRGDEVVIFGEGGISTEEVAHMVDTINYEVTCDISRRAHTFYIQK